MATPKLKAVVTSHADVIAAALADLSFDSRKAFINCQPTPMAAADVDKILDVKDASGASIWNKNNRHLKAAAGRIWKAGGDVTLKADKIAKDHAEANDLMKGNWVQLANRILDGVIAGLDLEPATTKAISDTKVATLAEKAEKDWEKGGQMLSDAIKNHPGLKTKAAKEKAAGLLEQLARLVG